MKEYIEREAAIHAVVKSFWSKPYISDVELAQAVRDVDAADVVERKRGEWEPVLDGVWNLPTPVLAGWRCSECGRMEQEKEPFCNCGADMRSHQNILCDQTEEVDHEN